MNISDKLQKRINEYMCKAEGKLHNDLMGVVQVAKNDGMAKEEVKELVRNLFRQRWPNEEPNETEVQNTVEHAFSDDKSTSSYTPYKAYNPQKKDWKAEIAEWRKALVKEPDFLKKVKDSDVSEVRVSTKKALRAIFKNVHGKVSQTEIVFKDGNATHAIKWMHTDDDFSGLDTSCDLFNPQTFGDDDKRTNENIDYVAAVLIEIDHVLDGRKNEEVPNLKEVILNDTCYLLEEAGLKPTTITFSGNKSYHCLFRLSKPIKSETFNIYKDELKEAYSKIGADTQVLTLSRCTRMPKGCTQLEAKEGKIQRVMYLDEEAEISFEDFVAKVSDLAKKISREEKFDIKDLPIKHIIVKKKDKDGNEAISKDSWEYDCEKWENFLKFHGVSKTNDCGIQRIIHKNKRGIFVYLNEQEALDLIVNSIKRINYRAGAHFQDKMGKRLSSSSLEMYAGIFQETKIPEDTKYICYMPFENGMITITKEEIMLHADDYMGFDIPASTPTLNRSFYLTNQTSDFERFIDYACGRAENHPQWQSRKKSLMILLGYLISNYHLEINPICFLTEESMTENDGGTGKSLIMKSVSYFRKRYFKDCKSEPKEAQTFEWADMTSDVHYIQMDDLPKGYSIDKMFSKVTGDWVISKKFKNEKMILPQDKAPKMVAGTNYYPKINGNSDRRRLKIYEISNHYGNNIEPTDDLGKRLFDEWNKEEWNRFDNFMLHCVQMFLCNNCKLIECQSTNMEQKILEAKIDSNVIDWLDDLVVMDNYDNYYEKGSLVKMFYDWYQKKYGRQYIDSFKPSTKYLVSSIKIFCSAKHLSCTDENKKLDKKQTRCIKFGYFFNSSSSSSYEIEEKEIEVPTVSEKPVEETLNYKDDIFIGGAPDADKYDEEKINVTENNNSLSLPPPEMKIFKWGRFKWENDHIYEPVKNHFVLIDADGKYEIPIYFDADKHEYFPEDENIKIEKPF